MADGGPPAGDVVERLRLLGRALDAAGGWALLPPPALSRARALFADAAAWREFYTHPESDDDGDSSSGSGDEAPLGYPPSAPAGGGRQPRAATDAATGSATGAASGVCQAPSTAAATAAASSTPFPLRAVLQRELTLRSIQAGLVAGGGEAAAGMAGAAAPGGGALSSSGGSGSGRPSGVRPPAGPAHVPPVSDVFQSVEAAPSHRPSPYVDDEIDVSDVVASRPDSPGGGGGTPTPALPPPPPVYVLMDGSSERFFGHGGDSPSGSSDASDDPDDEDGSDFSSSADGNDGAAARAGDSPASLCRNWDDPGRLAALACRLCALRSRLLPPEPPLGSAPRRGGVANGGGQAAKRRRRTGRRRLGGSDAEGSSTKRPRTAATTAVPDGETVPIGGGGGAAAPAAAANDDPSGDDATTPVKLPTSLCGADSDEGGDEEDDSQLGSADRNKQRMDDAKDALAHLVGSDSGEDEPGPVAKVLPVLSARRAVVARSSRPAESSSDDEPSPTKAAALVSPAALPSGSPVHPATADVEPAAADESGSSSSDESEGGSCAAAHAAAVEREAAAWKGALVAEVGYHARRGDAAVAATPVANGGDAAPPPATASTSTPTAPVAAAAATAAAASTVPPPSPAVHPLGSTLTPPLRPYVPHGERRVLAAYLEQALTSASEQARAAVAAASAVMPVLVESSAEVAALGGREANGADGDSASGGGAVNASHAVAVSAAGVLGALTGLLQSVRHGRLAAPATVVARVAAILGRAPAVFAPPLAAGPTVVSALTASVHQVNRQRRRCRCAAVAAAHSVAVTSVEQAAADVAFRRRVTVDIHRAALLSARPQWRALRRRTEAGTRIALASGGGCGVDWNREPPVCGLVGEIPPPSDSAFVFPEYGDVWNAVAPPPSLASVRDAQAADWRLGDSAAGGGDADDNDWTPNGGGRSPGAFRRNVDSIARMRRQRRRLSAYARSVEPTAEAFDLVAAGEDDAEDDGSPFWLPSRGDDGPSPDGTPGHREHTALRSVVALLLYHGGFEDASLAALNALTDATSALFERVATSLSAARAAPASLPPPPVPQSPPSRLPSTMMVHPLQHPLQMPRSVRGAHVPARLRHTPPPPHPHTALSDVVSVTQRVLSASGNRGGLPEIATYRAASAARVESTLRDSAMRLGIVCARVSESRVTSSRAALAAAAGAAGRADAGIDAKVDAPPATDANVESLLAGTPTRARQAPAGMSVAAAGALPQGVANGTPQAAPAAPATGAATPAGSVTAGQDGRDGAAAVAEDFPPAALLFGVFSSSAVVDVLCLSRLGLGSASVPPHMAAWALAPFALQAPPPPRPPLPAVKAEPENPLNDGGAALDSGAPSPFVIDAAAPGGGLDAEVAADLDGMDGVDFAGVANGLSIVNGGAAGASGGGPAGVLDIVDMDGDEDGAAAAAAVVLDELDVPLTALASVVNPVVGLSAGVTTAAPAASAAGAGGAPPTTPSRAAANGGGAEKSDGAGGHAGAEPSAVDYGLSWADAAGGDQDAERSVDQITALF